MARSYPTTAWPADFAAKIPQRVPNSPRAAKLLLGLDLGTTCGYALAYFRRGAAYEPTIYSGTWNLSAGSWDSGALRLVKLKQFLTVVQPDGIVYEDVKFTPGDMGGPGGGRFINAILARAATSIELLASFRAIVCEYAEENGIAATGIPIGHIKKRATGKGNANKEMVIQAANEQLGMKLDPAEEGVDNMADAIFCVLCGLEKLGDGL